MNFVCEYTNICGDIVHFLLLYCHNINIECMVRISGLYACGFGDVFVFCEGNAGQFNLMTLHST